jgi:predicted rRNA methylase YqxC with S4 and FtsJ domains
MIMEKRRKIELITSDLSSVFLDSIYPKIDKLTKREIQIVKDLIDTIFIDNVKKAKSKDDIADIFNDYRAFFDVYQEFI